MSTFLFQSGAFRDMEQINCGICEIGPFTKHLSTRQIHVLPVEIFSVASTVECDVYEMYTCKLHSLTNKEGDLSVYQLFWNYWTGTWILEWNLLMPDSRVSYNGWLGTSLLMFILATRVSGPVTPRFMYSVCHWQLPMCQWCGAIENSWLNMSDLIVIIDVSIHSDCCVVTTVRCHYNSVNFLQNSHNRHP